MTYRQMLNPEIKPESISAFDIYNASTAFVTYRVGGAHMVDSNLRLSDKIQTILTAKTDRLIDAGNRRIAKYKEEVGKTATQSRIEVYA